MRATTPAKHGTRLRAQCERQAAVRTPGAARLLPLLLLLLILPSAVQAQFQYTTNNGTVTGSRCSGIAVTIPGAINGLSVTSSGGRAFAGCSGLASVTIPDSVTSVGHLAFSDCISLKEVYFVGNAPSFDSPLFEGDDNAILFYLPGTTGWNTTISDRPTALWNPRALTTNATFSMRKNPFGFTLAWANDRVIVVESSTNLVNPVWSPVGTNTLTSGSSYFSDPGWTNHPSRFYRLRSP